MDKEIKLNLTNYFCALHLLVILVLIQVIKPISRIRGDGYNRDWLRCKTENCVVERSKFNIEFNEVLSCILGQWSGPFLPIIQSHILGLAYSTIVYST